LPLFDNPSRCDEKLGQCDDRILRVDRRDPGGQPICTEACLDRSEAVPPLGQHEQHREVGLAIRQLEQLYVLGRADLVLAPRIHRRHLLGRAALGEGIRGARRGRLEGLASFGEQPDRIGKNARVSESMPSAGIRSWMRSRVCSATQVLIRFRACAGAWAKSSCSTGAW